MTILLFTKNVKRFSQIIVGIALTLSFLFLFPAFALANTTPFRSANIVTTDATGTVYTNLGNCIVTDGNTCDRALASSHGNLYFRDFGNYDNFGIPFGSTITKVRIRVTGKANIPAFALFVGLSSGKTFTSNCQTPSDLWTLWELNSSLIKTKTFIANVTQSGIPNAVKASCLSPFNFEDKNFIWRVNYSSGQNWSANIDNFEIAFDYDPPITPTPTPSPTPIPGPDPFLDLPWDYEDKGLTFNEAALAINSYFDHTYPLLGGGILEPNSFLNQITTFMNENSTAKDYSSHDGYDYGNFAEAHNGDPVLAAASGVAAYVNSCSACGNMIVIDHDNGYQTRYMHLQKDDLIIDTTGESIPVTARQQIGKVGSTGNSTGAHIHFGVFEDKNKDGNFQDNIPDGATDPFGWQSKELDPWENYSFMIGDENKIGNKSYYLWIKKLSSLDATLTSNGGVFNTERYELDFPQGSVLENINLIIQSSPIVKTLDNIKSLGSTIVVNAFDDLGNAVTDFTNPFKITVDFSTIDLSSYDTDTIFIYSSTDGINWIQEETTVNLGIGTATAEIDHITQFALMAERLDTSSPVTHAILNGLEGQPNWFRSDVEVSLNAEDDILGVDYTLYKREGEDWETYIDPLIFTTEGHHKLEFYSVDKDDNIENLQSVEFDIDKTRPVVDLDANPKAIWPPNSEMINISITGGISDLYLFSQQISVVDEYDLVEPEISVFGQTIQLEARRNDDDLDGRTYLIMGVAEDLAGNTNEDQVQSVVLHDKGKNK